MYATLARVLFPNAYRIRDYSFETTVVATNKATYVAYRGPWESETWARERLLDVIAAELGLEPVDVRARNLLGADELPTKMVTGSDARVRDRARDARAGRRASPTSRPSAPSRPRQCAAGRYLGIGVRHLHRGVARAARLQRGARRERVAPIGAERRRARLEPDGTVSVFTSQQPHGQGHETTLAQLAADGLGIGHEQVHVVHGDTDVTPFNLVGTGGSRAATLASGAVVGAVAALRERIDR